MQGQQEAPAGEWIWIDGEDTGVERTERRSGQEEARVEERSRRGWMRGVDVGITPVRAKEGKIARTR